jgi:HSP20 family molecular chaperone IbpA
LSLPFPVDAGKVSAILENGVLQIRLPKAEEAKSKRIEVK